MDGRAVARKVRDEVAARMSEFKKRGVEPKLAAIMVGEDPSSRIYINGKREDCREVGINFELHELPSSAKQDAVVNLIRELNDEPSVHGIIVQLPLPSHIDRKRIFSEIDPGKDVDGLTPTNVGKLWLGDYTLDGSLLPSTPKGIMRLLEDYGVETEGKNAVIINRSDLVGKPLAKMLLDRNATVTLCHSKTPNLAELARTGDILTVAVGKRPSFVVGENMVKEGAVVIDVGMNRVEGRLLGDVDFESVQKKASYITPVPGGVGPMTRAMLLENLAIALELLEG
ncbi:MAG: bifunctional 5,10-methylenetetrahydrofolate dehydrogenase/5,10-methenyltetrahydrofolate cyclohydrolase [Candidatus Hadarchaeales archaeon]